MRILITGATGLVGSHLSKLCRERGVAINYLTTSRSKIKKGSDYRGFYWDPENGDIDGESLKDIDAIVHLAGASVAKRWTENYKKEIVDSRVKSAALLYSALEELNFTVPHFISASGISVYPSSLEKLYTEDERAVDDSFLGEVVERWEAAADDFEDLDMKVSKVRTGLVLARNGGALPKMKIPASYHAGSAFGSGRQWQSWIHIDDLAGIYFHIIENRLEGTFNAVAPNPVTNEELMEKIAQELNKGRWLPNIPSSMLKIILGEMSSAVLSSQLVSSEKVQNAGYRFKYKNLSKALENLL